MPFWHLLCSQCLSICVFNSYVHCVLGVRCVLSVHHIPNVKYAHHVLGTHCVPSVWSCSWCLSTFQIPLHCSSFFFPFYMFSITFVPTLIVSWNFVGGRLLDACNFNKNFYTSNTFIVFPKLIHFYSFLFYFIFIC